jgi:hypothetical protein
MPRDFIRTPYITLSDMPQAVLGITCDLCQRREQFDVEALKAQHGGDVKMPELLSRLVTDCPRKGRHFAPPGATSGRVRGAKGQARAR